MEIVLKCHSLCDKYQMTLLGMKSGLRDENQASNSQTLDESMNIRGYSRMEGIKILEFRIITAYLAIPKVPFLALRIEGASPLECRQISARMHGVTSLQGC
jgi:hypothetical protein